MMKKICTKIRFISLMAAASGFLLHLSAQTLSGKIVNEQGGPLGGALVRLVNAGLSDTTGADGTWSITVPTGIESTVRTWLLPTPALRGSSLYFCVNNREQPVQVSVYSLNGNRISGTTYRNLAPGFYSLNPLDRTLSPGLYAVRFRLETKIFSFRLLLTSDPVSASGPVMTPDTKNIMVPSTHPEKRLVIIDTLKVSKVGYTPVSLALNSYSEAPLSITLKVFVPAYHLNPPNPCYNQFYVTNCIPGDPNSACGGKCIVANSCSPPEDPKKADLPKTFICPRFMLYSSEMLQAAKDDAALYGWSADTSTPFTYGVVGHDADVGGLDDISSSCCQCYQIIFVSPEPSSPQPPDLPYPKPLIVQSFNTAASGPKGFDVFMAAGGYGAFNACYKDAEFSNTTKFNEFMYDKFPYQNPGSGGISFLRYPECIKGWPPTVEGVLSAACQDKIKQMCDQALMSASPQITEDTRRSCIECNKLTSLYHQNWQVMVKRVRCPENLTRVTGCRLSEPSLSLPLPKIRTPEQAKTDPTFKSGYHTTTMQDCCKPTCAWQDWVTGSNYKLPADGEWNSFYSCDKNGVPLTK